MTPLNGFSLGFNQAGLAVAWFKPMNLADCARYKGKPGYEM